MSEPMAIVGLHQVLAHLRVEAGVEDDLIAFYLSAAVQSASDFLNRKIYANAADMEAAVLDASAGDAPLIINDAVRAAILLIVAQLYAYREDSAAGTSSGERLLPSGSRQLLFPYRAGLGV